MVDTIELKSELAVRNISQAKLARNIGITPKTFYIRMKRKMFTTVEIDKIVVVLNLSYDRAMDIFFPKKVE